MKLPKPNLTFEVNIDSSLNKLYVKIKSNYFAKGVNIRTSSKLNYSENYFDLDANQEKTVSIDLLPNENLDRLIKSIKVNSLWSSSH